MSTAAKLIELTVEECWEHLREAEVGRVAVTVGTAPDIFPVNYLIHDDAIVIRTEAGTKLAAGTLMSSVAFEIDGIDDAEKRGWSVVVKGHGREATHLEEILSLDDLGLRPWADTPKSRWMVIDPIEITGRRIV